MLGALQMARNILVIRFSSVGDVMLTSGALSALKRAAPDAAITYVTKSAFVDLVRHHPAVSNVVALTPGENVGALLARLQQYGPYEGVIDLHGKLRSRWIAARTKAQRKVAWDKRPLADTLLVPMRLRKYHAKMPIAARYHGAVERFVGRELPREPLSYVVADEAVASARRILIERGVDLARPLVVMSPGALWPTKQWPLERFAALAAKADVTGATVVLTGSVKEAELTRSVRNIAPLAIDVAGALALSELGGVLSHARAVVANDSGPMHMARALGVPTLAFFGSTDPTQFRFDGHALAWAGVECAPCSLHGLAKCPRGHFRCMNDIDVDRAFALLDGLLKGPARAQVTD